MTRSLLGLTVALGLVVAGATVPASAAEGNAGRVCPTDDFFVGAVWGADRGSRIHAGIDLGGKRGTPIYAIEDGVIDRTKVQSNGAIQIVMRGVSGSKFYYGHMDKVLISGGQRVKAGEVIALMGDTGSPGQVHLHFEYWRSGGESDAVDPEPLVREVCRIDKSGNGDNGPDPEPQADAPVAPPAPAAVRPAAKPKPAAKPRPAADPAVQGDVFTN
jgi:ribosomal protein L27